MMDGSKSELLNGNVRGNMQSRVLFSSIETDPEATQSLSVEKDGCEKNTQNCIHEVRSVVQPSDINKNDALHCNRIA